MAWIESHQNIKEHKKTYALMASLGCSKRDAVAIVHMLWWWCLDNALDGVIEVPAIAIKAATEWEADADKLVQSLVQAGWLEVCENGGWSVHDWHHYCGALVEKRLERKHFREKKTASVRRPKVSRSGDKSRPTVSVSESIPEPKPKDKDIAPLRAANTSPHVIFVEGFKSVYQEVTGSPFKIDQKHWVISASLVKAHGIDECVKKAKTLGVLCRDRSSWFTKDGFASFTIETLSSKWNNIIPEAVPPTKEEELLKEIKRQEEMRARADEIIANGSRKVTHL